ncbi:hypothetical protein H181DRAFT_01877 [Streptomyces sp. WMMB 714]|nr:hypothetical protein H181DRAFT_01877 [Streptomyces sp. WMMB 714]
MVGATGPRWRLMVLLGAFATLRPEELACVHGNVWRH